MCIPNEKRSQILEKLSRIESERGVKILYAIESGSRAWGFPSPDSDYDVRFLYIHPLKWYLSIRKRKDHLNLSIIEDLDCSGWDVDKALVLFRKSNPALLEWLRSPIVYIEQGSFASELQTLSEKHFSPLNSVYHYLHMANGNFKDYINRDKVRIKKYFYVLRPVLAAEWIAEELTQPPVEFERLLDKVLVKYPTIYAVVRELLARKTETNEMGEQPAILELNDFLEERIAYHYANVKSVPAKQTLTGDELDALFVRILEDSWGIQVPG